MSQARPVSCPVPPQPRRCQSGHPHGARGQLHHFCEPALPGRGLWEAETPRSPHGGDVEAKDQEEEACRDVDYDDSVACCMYLAVARDLHCGRCQFTPTTAVGGVRSYATTMQHGPIERGGGSGRRRPRH